MDNISEHKHFRAPTLGTYSDYTLELMERVTRQVCETCYNKIVAELEKRKTA